MSNRYNNKKSTGGALQLDGNLLGTAASSLDSFIQPLMPADAYGGRSAGSHITGGGLKGAGAGAAIGTMFGPLGTLIGAGAGALLGGVSGAIQNNKEDNKFKEAMASRRASFGNAFNMGGRLYSTNSQFFPAIKYLGGSWNSYNALNKKAMGGTMDTLTEFNSGGSHEMNPMGGIPLGMNPNGQPNLVEEGETRWQDYIFSDRLKVHKPINYGLPNKLGTKTFSQASKILNKEAKERPYDLISKRGADSMMNRLMESSEMAKDLQEMKTNNNMFYPGGQLDLISRFGFNRQNNFEVDPLVNKPLPFLNDTEQILDRVTGGYRHSPLQGRFSHPGPSIGQIPTMAGNPQATDYSKELTVSNQPTEMPYTKRTAGDFLRGNEDGFNSAMRYSPIAFNALAAMTLRKPEDVTLPRIGGSMQQYNYFPKYMDETRGLGTINSAHRGTMGAIMENSGGNSAAARASILGSMPGFLRGRENLYSSINSANIDQYTRSQEGARQLGLQGAMSDQQTARAEEEINAMNRGAYTTNKYNLLGSAFTGLGQVGTENYWGEMISRLYGYDSRGRNAQKFGGKLKTFKFRG